jgi:hypothetical protein
MYYAEYSAGSLGLLFSLPLFLIPTTLMLVSERSYGFVGSYFQITTLQNTFTQEKFFYR